MAKRPVSASPRRRRDAAATREAILEAATRRFATQGYERAGVREIAADAGVTAALVNRYFGSKEGLFAEVIRRALDMGHLLQGQRGDLADHLARLMVYGGDDSPGRGAARRSCSCCIPPRCPAPSSCSGGTSTAPSFRSSPSRSAATTPRSGPSWSWHSSRGSRSCITCSAPRRSRMPVAKSWSPSCPRPSPLVSSEAPRVRLPFRIPRTHGFGTRTTPGGPAAPGARRPPIMGRRSLMVWPFIVVSPVIRRRLRPGLCHSRSSASRTTHVDRTRPDSRRSSSHSGSTRAIRRAMASPAGSRRRSACDLTG